MESVAKSLEGLEIGEMQLHRNLAMWPLVGAGGDGADHLLLAEAVRAGLVVVTEISEGGRVGEMKLTNSAELPVLVLEGETLVGAKQNRTTNLSILAPARSTIIIPVSCVEAGRWHPASREAKVSDHLHMARARAAKVSSVSYNIHHGGYASSDQGRVWQDIDEASIGLEVRSPTRSMAAIYESHAARIDGFAAAFRPVERQVGALFAIAGDVVGLDLFGEEPTLRAMLPKLVRSCAVEALQNGEGAGEPARATAEAFVGAVAAAAVETFPAVGLGTTVRLAADGLVGGGLVHDDRLLHLAAFAVESERSVGGNGGRVASPSTRRRRYRS
jgi:hypothetical protein